MIYIKYLLYILEHKKNVFIECWQEGLYLHAFTHDLSKFLPSEFIPYARYFMGNGSKEEFKKAWELHYNRNKHHPEHWGGNNMPTKNIEQMVCDLKAMSRKFGGTAQEYYLKNYYKWDLNYVSRWELEKVLKLTNCFAFSKSLNRDSWEYYQTIENFINEFEKHYNLSEENNLYYREVEEEINELLKPACDKYRLNIYKLFKESVNK